MSWQGVLGHDAIVERFRTAVARGRLASTYLFIGPEGVGKRTFALKLAQALLCEGRPAGALDPCLACRGCRLTAAQTHPDLLLVRKPAERSFIPLEAFVGRAHERMQTGLCHDLSLKPFLSQRKVAIIDDADYLNEEGANALLKTLEEPPPRSVLILIGSQLQRQLPTIRSRAQLIRFSPLPVETVERILLAEGLITDPQPAREAALRSSGSVTQACELADEALAAYRHTLLHALAQPAWDSVGLARNTAQFIEQAGKDQPPRRARARQLVNAALAFYSTLLRAQAQAPSAAPPEILAAAQAALRGGQTDVQATLERLESCLQALEHIDRNVIQTNWLEVWFDSLARAQCALGPW